MSMVSIEPLKVNGDALLAINNEIYTLEDERLEATAITNLERKMRTEPLTSRELCATC